MLHVYFTSTFPQTLEVHDLAIKYSKQINGETLGRRQGQRGDHSYGLKPLLVLTVRARSGELGASPSELVGEGGTLGACCSSLGTLTTRRAPVCYRGRAATTAARDTAAAAARNAPSAFRRPLRRKEHGRRCRKERALRLLPPPPQGPAVAVGRRQGRFDLGIWGESPCRRPPPGKSSASPLFSSSSALERSRLAFFQFPPWLL
jgi:hypothetical protein